MGIDFPDGATAVVWVGDVIGSEAVIQASDQTKWRMVIVDPKDLEYPPAPTEEAACTYWKVKERKRARGLVFSSPKSMRADRAVEADQMRKHHGDLAAFGAVF